MTGIISSVCIKVEKDVKHEPCEKEFGSSLHSLHYENSLQADDQNNRWIPKHELSNVTVGFQVLIEDHTEVKTENNICEDVISKSEPCEDPLALDISDLMNNVQPVSLLKQISPKCRERTLDEKTGKNVYKCSICGFLTPHFTNINRHINAHFGLKPFNCTVCNYKGATRSHVSMHMKRHSIDKPFQCSHCEYCTAHKHDLNRHQMIHSGEKPFSCSFCSYKCSRSSRLKTHISVVHKSDQHLQSLNKMCLICGLNFYNAKELNKHKVCHPEILKKISIP